MLAHLKIIENAKCTLGGVYEAFSLPKPSHISLAEHQRLLKLALDLHSLAGKDKQ